MSQYLNNQYWYCSDYFITTQQLHHKTCIVDCDWLIVYLNTSLPLFIPLIIRLSDLLSDHWFLHLRLTLSTITSTCTNTTTNDKRIQRGSACKAVSLSHLCVWRVFGRWPRCWGLQVSPHTLHHSSSSSHRRQTNRLAACGPRTELRDDQSLEGSCIKCLVRLSCRDPWLEALNTVMQILQEACEYVWCIRSLQVWCVIVVNVCGSETLSCGVLVLAVRMWENKSRNCLENDRQRLSPTGFFFPLKGNWLTSSSRNRRTLGGLLPPSCLSYSLSLKLVFWKNMRNKLQKKIKKSTKMYKMYQVTIVFTTIRKIIQLLRQLKNQINNK